MRRLVWVRDGRRDELVATRAQCAALAEYLRRTFRITATMTAA
jgi:hypothetical protein